jgi:chromosome partitioning protein
MCKVVAIANAKGGTGKTTTAVNLSAALAARGTRVLLIDLDPQGNASTYVGAPDDGRDMLAVFSGERRLVDIVRETTFGVDLAPAGEWLAGAERVLAGELGAEMVFKEAVQQLPTERWDLVVIDCPPSLGLLSVSALVACDAVLIPVLTEAMPLEGVAQFLRTVERVRQRLNPDLRIAGVLPLKTESTKLSRSVEEALRSSLGDGVFEHVVRKNVKVAESYSHKAPVSHYAPRSPGASDFKALVDELMGRVA